MSADVLDMGIPSHVFEIRFFDRADKVIGYWSCVPVFGTTLRCDPFCGTSTSNLWSQFGQLASMVERRMVMGSAFASCARRVVDLAASSICSGMNFK